MPSGHTAQRTLDPGHIDVPLTEPRTALSDHLFPKLIRHPPRPHLEPASNQTCRSESCLESNAIVFAWDFERNAQLVLRLRVLMQEVAPGTLPQELALRFLSCGKEEAKAHRNPCTNERDALLAPDDLQGCGHLSTP
jgi:hypothetical protein